MRKATTATLHAIATRLGLRVSQRVLAQSAARALPVVGSLGVAGFAYYDTLQVAETTLKLLAQELDAERDGAD